MEDTFVLKRNTTMTWDKWNKNMRLEGKIDSEKLDNLADKIIDWYKVKFLLKENEMTIEDLINDELTKEEANLLDCCYHSGFEGLSFFPEDGINKFENRILIKLDINKKRNKPIAIAANSNGIIRGVGGINELVKVLDLEQEEVANVETLNDLEELLMSNSNDIVDYRQLSRCISNYKKDLLLREEFISYVLFKMYLTNQTIGGELVSNFVEDYDEHYNSNIMNTNNFLKMHKDITSKKRIKAINE